MTDPSKNQELLEENTLLRQKIQELEQSGSERKEMEEALRESEEKFRFIVDNSMMPMIISSLKDYRVIFYNIFASEFFADNSPAGSVKASDYWVRPFERDIFIGKLKEKGSVKEYEAELRTATGEHKWCLLSAKIINYLGDPASFVMFNDITELKHAEEALRESENWYRTIFENTGTATVILDENTTIILANAEYEKLSGYTKNELEGKKSWTDFVVKEDLKRMIASHRQRRIVNNDVPKSYEFRFKDKKGHIKNIFLTVDIIPGTKRSVASLLDITERKQVEEVMVKEHQKLISILDGIPVSAFVIDHNSRVIMWNLVNEFFTGISKEQVLGKKIDLRQLFKDKAPPILAELVLRMTDEEILDKFAEKGMWKSNIHPEAFESIGSIWINEKEYVMAIQTTRLRNAQGEIVGAVQCAQDITERKQAEEERERLISELQNALSEVKKLSGMLPICSSCKNIRDDKGYWKKIELYIRDHSEAKFSHSICPDCAKKLYPDIYERICKNKKDH